MYSIENVIRDITRSDKSKKDTLYRLKIKETSRAGKDYLLGKITLTKLKEVMGRDEGEKSGS